MNQDKIGKFIKDIRKKNNLTQAELANKLGVTYQAVSKWENGKNIPDIAILKQISEMFNVDINEILSGERKKKKNYFLLFLPFILFILLFIVFTHSKDFTFKTITTSCDEFTISGSAAYNKDKTSIYISNIEFCGKDNKVYSNINCTLYEEYKGKKTKISSCKSKKNISLKDYLKQVKVQVDNYSGVCSELTKSNLYLEINAAGTGKKTYKVPLELNDNC